MNPVPGAIGDPGAVPAAGGIQASRSRGMIRHWQPDRSTKKMASSTSRSPYLRGAPPLDWSRTGISGAITAHAASRRSDG